MLGPSWGLFDSIRPCGRKVHSADLAPARSCQESRLNGKSHTDVVTAQIIPQTETGQEGLADPRDFVSLPNIAGLGQVIGGSGSGDPLGTEPIAECRSDDIAA